LARDIQNKLDAKDCSFGTLHLNNVATLFCGIKNRSSAINNNKFILGKPSIWVRSENYRDHKSIENLLLSL